MTRRFLLTTLPALALAKPKLAEPSVKIYTAFGGTFTNLRDIQNHMKLWARALYTEYEIGNKKTIATYFRFGTPSYRGYIDSFPVEDITLSDSPIYWDGHVRVYDDNSGSITMSSRDSSVEKISLSWVVLSDNITATNENLIMARFSAQRKAKVYLDKTHPHPW